MSKVRILVLVMMSSLLVFGSGCTNWKKKYESCNAEYENLQSLFDGANAATKQCQQEKSQLEQRYQALLAQLKQAQNKPKPVAQPSKAGSLEALGGKYNANRGTITVTLTNDVLFSSGKVTLKSSSRSRLNRIAQVIKRDYPGKEVWVIGYTDSDPIRKSKWKDNWQLSTERALAVTRYLIQEGISARHLVAAGRGQYHPVSSEKAKNRRVEIVVYTR